jgi:hypothetical protein
MSQWAVVPIVHEVAGTHSWRRCAAEMCVPQRCVCTRGLRDCVSDGGDGNMANIGMARYRPVAVYIPYDHPVPMCVHGKKKRFAGNQSVVARLWHASVAAYKFVCLFATSFVRLPLHSFVRLFARSLALSTSLLLLQLPPYSSTPPYLCTPIFLHHLKMGLGMYCNHIASHLADSLILSTPLPRSHWPASQHDVGHLSSH